MRLLQKTVRRYIVYSVFILAVAIPVFYLVIKQVIREDADEHLQAIKAAVKPRIEKAMSDHTIGRLYFADQDIVLSAYHKTPLFETLTDEDLYDTVSRETVPYRVLSANFIIDGSPYLLQIRNSMLDSEDLIETIVKVQIVLLLLLLSGLLVINRNLSKSIWRPFYSTLDKLRNYKVEQHRSLELTMSSVNEFDDLNRSLEELAGRAHQAYRMQKEFTENAAHEMQTPLSILKSKVELLMQTSSISEEQAELIGEMADASQRMGKLNQSLILLTRIENLQFTETESISLKEVIEKAVVLFQPQWEESQLRVRCDYKEDIFREANRPLLEILVNNLFGNAIRHNIKGGRIGIVLSGNRLVIQNTGRPSELDTGQIFRRFHKESNHVNSIGLGLAVVKQIGNLYGWWVSYAYREGGGFNRNDVDGVRKDGECREGLHTFSVLFS